MQEKEERVKKEGERKRQTRKKIRARERNQPGSGPRSTASLNFTPGLP